MLMLSHCAFAAEPPRAGSQMQQIPTVPKARKAVPKIQIEQDDMVPIGSEKGKTITVQRLQVTGMQAYSERALLAITGFRPGSELTLTNLRVMAKKITDHYRRNGHFLAYAYLPAQDILEGSVTIAVLEGRYGQVTLRNQGILNDGLAQSLVGGLNSGDPIASGPLENSLLLLSDLPGVRAKSTLVPGASLGTSDLSIAVTPGPRVSGSVDADNAGNRYTGKNRIGATINLNNLAGHGDVATLRVLTSGDGLDYARAAYQMQFGKTRIGVAYSYLDYALGEEFASLQAGGSVAIASIYGSYPLIRSRSGNLYASLAFDNKVFQDRMNTPAFVADKKAQVLMASLHGDHRDQDGAGSNSYALTWATGNIDLQTPQIQAINATTARSSGHYNKLGWSAARLQQVTDSVSLYAAISGQFASKNLDSSEKIGLGGMYAVRAYPEGEAYGDQGQVLNLEARITLPSLFDVLPGQTQLVGFVDTGSVDIDKQPWTDGPRRRTLSAAGIGLTWTHASNFIVRSYYAHKLGHAMATSAPDASARFWIQAVKYF